jgi:valyl-tRNA synthetase
MQQVVKNKQIQILPERFEKTYFHWINNLRDWCISRQIWFGHQIPVWYKPKFQGLLALTTHDVYVGDAPPEGEGWQQDPDTLDTWFSSGLWTFSTLLNKDFEKYSSLEEWLRNSPDFKNFHPTSVLETGYDILFFWVARMILMTTYTLGDIPFKTVYLHGLVRDEQGRKMSKTLGNIIDPLDMIAKYGTDATRLSLLIGSAPGNDMKLSEEKIAGFRNFANKLWNISRFILSQIDKEQKTGGNEQAKRTLSDSWILDRLERVRRDVTENLEKYNFSYAGERLRDFTWNELAEELLLLINDKVKSSGYTVSLEKSEKQKEDHTILFKAIPIGFIFLILFFLLQKSGILNLGIGGNITPTTSFIIGLIASVSSCLAIVGGLCCRKPG